MTESKDDRAVVGEIPVDPATASVVVEPKIHIVAMPKSGINGLAMLIRAISSMWLTNEKNIQWCGSFIGDGWHTERKPIDIVVQAINRQPRGTYLQGHLAPDPEVLEALWETNTSVIFLMRDLRDVAVSQAYHILAAGHDEHLNHPHPELFLEMESFGDVLEAVIRGVEDPEHPLAYWPGLMERWEIFAGWRDVDWVCQVRYEDLVNNFEEAAAGIVRYVIGYHVYRAGYSGDMDAGDLDHLVHSARLSFGMKQLSTTFRRGKPGGWVDDFTPGAVSAFVESGGADELIRLGYEKDKEWTQKWA